MKKFWETAWFGGWGWALGFFNVCLGGAAAFCMGIVLLLWLLTR